MYKNNILIKSFLGSAAIGANLIVKFGSADDTVSPATAVSDLLLGVMNGLGLSTTDVANGIMGDVVLDGIAEVKLGGTVTRGQRLTCDSASKAVAAAPSAGVNNQIIGIALKSGVADDVIPVLLDKSTLQG